VKHQDGLLQRCKEIIMNNKEKNNQLAEEKAKLEQELEKYMMELNKVRVIV